jgi:hypothetical protein
MTKLRIIDIMTPLERMVCGMSLPSDLDWIRAKDARIAELQGTIAGLREFFRAYGINSLDDFMAEASDKELMAGMGTECANRTKSYVAQATELKAELKLSRNEARRYRRTLERLRDAKDAPEIIRAICIESLDPPIK